MSKQNENVQPSQGALQIKATTKQIKLHFFISAILMAVLGLSVSRGLIKHQDLFDGKSFTLQVIFILMVLIGIPSLLRWFHKNNLKLQQLEDIPMRLEGYRRAYLLRIYLFDFMAVLSLAFTLWTDMKQGILFFTMVFLFYFFFIPGESSLMRDLNLDEDGKDIPAVKMDTSVPRSEKGENSEDDYNDGFIPRKINKG